MTDASETPPPRPVREPRRDDPRLDTQGRETKQPRERRED